LVAAEKLAIPIAECVVFEDAPNGIEAGRRSGAGLVVGVGSEALETDADIVVKSLLGITFDGNQLSIPEQIRLR
jgi:sugar-phosphatase